MLGPAGRVPGFVQAPRARGPVKPPSGRGAGARIDRLAEQRRDEAWVAARLADRRTRVLPLWRSRHLVRGRQRPRPVWMSPQRLGELAGAFSSPVLLGSIGDRLYAAADLAGEDEQVAPRLAPAGRFEDLRQLAPRLDPGDAALLGYARAMSHWHRHHGHCADCGAPSRSREGGQMRRCTACGRVHFPRTDPAVITLVTARGACLLGRQAGWPAGLYSTLAGFVEPGESAEEAVVREVREETGIEVHGVRYHSSQPWPFPGSLMIGFRASARRAPPRIDRRELADALWLSRAELRAALASGGLALPPAYSIAHRLVNGWLEAG